MPRGRAWRTGLVVVAGVLWLGAAVGGGPRARAAGGATALPEAAAWGFGLTPPYYTSTTLWVAPQPDDEGSLWADELNTDGGSFPVFVYLTNGENTGFCTVDAALQRAPEGNLGAGDAPPFNTAGDLPGAPEGYLGPGPPPEYYGAQGDDPQVFPRDPALTSVTGWAPLASAGTTTAPALDNHSYTEGFDGPCRAARLAALTRMFSEMNRTVRSLTPAADRSFFPAIAPGAPPDGQTCFTSGLNELYRSQTGKLATPRPDGSWSGADVTPGVLSVKDPCAYYWLTPTGNVVVFDLGDLSSGFKSPCAYTMGGRLRTGSAWPGGANGYDSIGSYPLGARPGDSSGCTGALPGGQEGYGVTPSDALWAVQQVAGSDLVPRLPVKAVKAAAWVNGYNPAPGAPGGAAGPDVLSNDSHAGCGHLTAGGSYCAPQLPPPGPCQYYLPAPHVAAALALQWNQPLPGTPTAVSVCSGDPLAARTFGTTDRSDGIRFWTRVYDYDGGPGWEAADAAYAWLMGPRGTDPYGPVTDTCPGSHPVAVVGQSQFSCQESLTVGTGSPAQPGDGVEGMSNVYTGPTGEGFTRPS
ncbi:MAG TPA: hypothetical protein VFH50_14100 [Acidimicrobiales bacterium]|nr:hypothetical protein [Acidimicrobiales bacterium]